VLEAKQELYSKEFAMKPLIAFGVGIALLLCAEAAMSQDTNAPAAPQKKAAARSKGTIAQMDEQIKKMQAVHEKMIGATTGEERQQALEQARKETQAAMTMLQPAVRGVAGGADGSIAAEADAEVVASGFKGGRRQAHAETVMMTKRMDMMQMVVQLMLDQQAMTTSPLKSGGAAPKKK
jgi:hypothetical protein